MGPRFRSFTIALLLCLQCGVTVLQGQKVFLEPRDAVRICATEAFDEIEDFAFGPHRHDEIPLYVHVPEDDALRARKFVQSSDEVAPTPAATLCALHRYLLVPQDGPPQRHRALRARRADPRRVTMASLRVIRMLV